MRKQEDIIEVLVEVTCGVKRRGDQDIIYFKWQIELRRLYGRDNEYGHMLHICAGANCKQLSENCDNYSIL